MAKTANLYARIEPEIKEEAENILETLGIPASNAITMFYKQIIFHKGLPFDVKIPYYKPLNINEMTKEEFEKEIEKGYNDILKGRTMNIDDTFKEINKELNL